MLKQELWTLLHPDVLEAVPPFRHALRRRRVRARHRKGSHRPFHQRPLST